VMKKHLTTFALLTSTFIFLAFIVKSRYYYFPYPNLIDYFLSLVLIVITLITLFIRNKVTARMKVLTGITGIVILLACLNILNLYFEWHPLNLDSPFSKSQSFEVDFEPYKWNTTAPSHYGYREDSLTKYFENINEWERLRALLVVKGDKLIIEKYFCGATRYSGFNVHSVTKSMTSALMGLAIKHNYINSEDDLVLPFFPEYKDQPYGIFKKALTIKHLLSMRGGWASGDGHQTAEECIKEEYLNKMPDTEFNYFTGSHNILSAIITKRANQSTKDFAHQYLFKPLGMQNAFWRKLDPYYCGGDESYYTARDLARFGQLYLNKGNIDGKQILDSAWVDKSFSNYTTRSAAFRSTTAYEEVGYGLSWWIFKKDNETIYSARGKGGQHLMVIPSRNMLVVVLQEWNPLKKNARVEDELLGNLLELLLEIKKPLATPV
jgi:CubicO group peptidase (beta-lactamase class C family)